MTLALCIAAWFALALLTARFCGINGRRIGE